MKKLFISLVALVAVLASCSKSDVVSVPYENIPISFNPYNGRTPEVKSTTFDPDSLNSFKFHVSAFLNEASEYMDKDVWYDEENEKWDYDGVAYWPGTLPLEFVAYGLNTNYAGNTADDAIATLATNKRSLSVNVPVVVKDQRDLLVAAAQQNVKYSDDNSGVVDLTFNHMFSRIQFSLKTKSGNDVKVTMEDIHIAGDFASAGTIDLTSATPAVEPAAASSITYNYLDLASNESFTSTGSTDGTPIFDNSALWTKDSGDDATSEDDDEYVENTSATDDDTAEAAWNAKNHYMMIIPTESHNAKLFVKYFLPYAGTFDSDSNTATPEVDPIDLSGINFEAGKSYNFVLEVSTNSIEFSVEISEWKDGTIAEDKEVIKLN